MANIAQGKQSAVFVTRAVYIPSNKVAVFEVFYTNLLNKQTGFFDKMCQ